MSEENVLLQLEEDIVEALRTVYDPEIPVNVYDLGLIYRVDVDADRHVVIDMTFTAPSCPMADYIVEDTQMKVLAVKGVRGVKVNIVFEPAWDKEMMSDEAKLELGLL
ncbi:MAG: iron-sulfur cluster assembly protein [Tannerellaceae bacterium]|jgi:FeS assembly SUF system protein|nr:iron-sulfur cluster assembly protein [Tannerellaceae bacterium]